MQSHIAKRIIHAGIHLKRNRWKILLGGEFLYGQKHSIAKDPNSDSEQPARNKGSDGRASEVPGITENSGNAAAADEFRVAVDGAADSSNWRSLGNGNRRRSAGDRRNSRRRRIGPPPSWRGRRLRMSSGAAMAEMGRKSPERAAGRSLRSNRSDPWSYLVDRKRESERPLILQRSPPAGGLPAVTGCQLSARYLARSEKTEQGN
ncbi:hypothetical protein CRG98_025576 [Punica granatum]|uniref:Uncharacterized protein n=1 Tax=Punica granatum TaxID=22663 RepID=A0A2I0JCQ8_PUNGR|nr:hypothetical protein CRG98_025576 [Punica granatum]